MPRKTEHAARAARYAADTSMRPRPDAAENRRGGRAVRTRGPHFNEAAARCRGKPSR